VPLASAVRNTDTVARVQITARRDRVLGEWAGIVLLDCVARNMAIVVVVPSTALRLWAVGRDLRVRLGCVVASGDIVGRDLIIVVRDLKRGLGNGMVFGARFIAKVGLGVFDFMGLVVIIINCTIYFLLALASHERRSYLSI